MPPKSKAKPAKADKKAPAKADKKPAKGQEKGKVKGTAKAEDVKKSVTAAAPVAHSEGQDDEEETRKRSSEESLTEVHTGHSAKKLRLVADDPLKKAIEEIEMEEPSSEEDEDAYYNRTTRDSVIADADEVLAGPIMSIEEEYDTTAESDSDPEYVKQHDLVEEPDFLGNFGDMPEIEQVSEDVSVEKVEAPPPPKPSEQIGPKDKGKFVNPLTGEIMVVKERPKEVEPVVAQPKEATSKTVVQKPTQQKVTQQKGHPQKPAAKQPPVPKVEEKKADEDRLDISSIESVELPIFSDESKEDVKKGKGVEEDALNQFLELEAAGPILTADEIDIEALLREELARQLREQTADFVEYLITMVVEKAEYVDPEIILRQNLDKRKLLRELQDKHERLDLERKTKSFLNRKCVEYFRRKRSFRPIMDENPKTLKVEYHKFLESVSNLDHWLIKEDEAKTVSKIHLDEAREQLSIAQTRANDKVNSLEELIRKTLRREGFNQLQEVVNYYVAQMQEVRTEISEVRFQLIQKQHNISTLIMQLHKLEDLGNGLSMRNFETIQTETQALGKKIEERNAELTKLRNRCYGDIHRMAHLRDKQKMLRESIGYQRQYMDELQDEKQDLREFLFNLKVERNQLRIEMRNTSFQSGLLDKPVLMKDYDATVVYLEHLRHEVETAQATIQSLNEKIEYMENNCM